MILRLLSTVVRSVATLVPGPERAQWREEWLGELQQIAARRGAMTAGRALLGMVPDAIALRRLARSRAWTNAPGTKRRLGWPFSFIDFKLGVRMLLRYPGLTFVGVLGMAVGIMIAAGAFSILYTLTAPSLPLDEGDRIVTIHNVDSTTRKPDRRALHDFRTWRDELTSVQDLGAYRQIARNLIVPGMQSETVQVAEMSASGFRVARIPALMGRYLTDEDERAAAPPVLVLGYDVWRSRFKGDPGIIGRSVQLGDTWHAVVGVMPEGFEFPVNHHYWVPLRLNATVFERRSGPSIVTFGRLAPGTTFESAQAELSAIGQRTAELFPKTHETLRPQVLPYTYPFFDIDDPSIVWLVHLMQFMITLLLVIICVNVAILVYARTARRQGEIAVRSALGASRGRIVSQLFAEGLALAGVAAIVGVWLTAVGLAYVNELTRQILPLPFWWTFTLSPGVLLYAVGLTFLSAAIIGVFPALKATGRRLQTGLQSISAGGGAAMRLGRTWTVLIVAQVAIAVALLPAAVFHAYSALQYGTADPGFAAHEYLTTQLVLDPGDSTRPAPDGGRKAADERYARAVAEVIRRLRAESAVSDLTFGTSVAGQEATMVIEVEGQAPPARAVDYNIREGSRIGHLARFNRVDVDFFRTFGVPLLGGRSLRAADAARGATAVLVNRTFADRLLGGANALGRRVRYVGRSGDASPGHVELGRWYEIVGVVSDFPAINDSGLADAKIYHATEASQVSPATLALRIRGDAPLQFSPRLRDIVAAVDPNLQVRGLATLDATLLQDQSMMRLVAAVLSVLTLSVVLLSSAGIYSMMSFTVSQRRKEIGIRAALGADPRRILGSIFSRVLWQLAVGSAIGVGVAALLERATEGGLMQGHGAVVLPIVAVVMMIVGVLAAIGPARRGLHVPPTEALRQE